ncbi:TetR family transcriptional regulator [Paraburkholderia fungorum]|jgi:AcrR family transcriptional regulator|uniref:TetR/AcrR family transcriptional regulator n=1 Tax=Paraburkholderia fungorum TaxID=134537 RepID=UPI0005A7A298|nr:TetR/AcrR family transcriptional regulator [Paraburkholderia fungorum]MBB5539790.1 AcrR family transcriptional regulator [Paraburkholderia fungorum]PNE53189.1 TetR family transcriptional regulator [Paraburkholderia fungorum]
MARTVASQTRQDRPAGTGQAPTAGRRGRPVGDHKIKRDNLLAAAAAVIAREGYAGTSLRKIAVEAGCTTGALSYYFEDKDEIVKALVESSFDLFDTILESTETPIDVRTTLERWISWHTAKDRDPRLVQFQLLGQAKYEPVVAAVIHRRYSQYRLKLTAIVASDQNRGVIRDDIPADIIADQVCALGDGWSVMLPVEPERFKPRRLKALSNAFFTLLSPPQPAGETKEPIHAAPRRPK